MSVFSDKNIEAAIARLPQLSTADLKEMQKRADKAGAQRLVDACGAQLRLRPMELTADTARAHAAMEDQTRDMTLVDAIRHAFVSVRPLSIDEERFIRWLGANPNGDYQSAKVGTSDRGLSLTIGHFVYDRHGCFRKWMPERDISGILFRRDKSGDSVTYSFQPEAELVFREMGLLPA